MTAIYQGKAEELDQNFIESVEAVFKDKEIEITVYERNETDYLLRSPANREQIVRAIGDVENSENIDTPDQDQFQ